MPRAVCSLAGENFCTNALLEGHAHAQQRPPLGRHRLNRASPASLLPGPNREANRWGPRSVVYLFNRRRSRWTRWAKKDRLTFRQGASYG